MSLKIRFLSSQALLGVGLVLLATIISLILFITADDELNQSTQIDKASVPAVNTNEIIPTTTNNLIDQPPIFEDELVVGIELPPDWDQLTRAEKRQLNPNNCDFTSHYMDDDGRCVDHDMTSTRGDELLIQQTANKVGGIEYQTKTNVECQKIDAIGANDNILNLPVSDVSALIEVIRQANNYDQIISGSTTDDQLVVDYQLCQLGLEIVNIDYPNQIFPTELPISQLPILAIETNPQSPIHYHQGCFIEHGYDNYQGANTLEQTTNYQLKLQLREPSTSQPADRWQAIDLNCEAEGPTALEQGHPIQAKVYFLLPNLALGKKVTVIIEVAGYNNCSAVYGQLNCSQLTDVGSTKSITLSPIEVLSNQP